MGWEYVIYLVVTLILSYALTPKPKTPEAATLKDFDLPTPEEGTPQIVVFGDVWIDGWTVLNYGNLRTSKVYADGGK